MAIATLSEVYNNPDVFRGVVKIRKGLACRMILESGDLDGLFFWFNKLSTDIAARIPPSDPCAGRTAAVCKTAVDLSKPASKSKIPGRTVLLVAAIPAVLASCAYIFYGRR